MLFFPIVHGIPHFRLVEEIFNIAKITAGENRSPVRINELDRVVQRIVVRRYVAVLLRQRIHHPPPAYHRVVQPRAVVIELHTTLKFLPIVKIVIFDFSSLLLSVIKLSRIPVVTDPGQDVTANIVIFAHQPLVAMPLVCILGSHHLVDCIIHNVFHVLARKLFLHQPVPTVIAVAVGKAIKFGSYAPPESRSGLIQMLHSPQEQSLVDVYSFQAQLTADRLVSFIYYNY